jgi:hypothetical protein
VLVDGKNEKQRFDTMLKHLHLLLHTEVALFVVVQFALLAIQGAALRRHRQRSFQLLVRSTVCGIALLIANSSVQVFRPTGDWIFWLYSFGFLFGVASALFTLAGFVLLFRDYQRLAEYFSKASTTQDVA